MNAAFLLLSSALVPGAGPQAAPPVVPPLAAVVAPAPHAAPCCAVAAPSSDACARRGLFAHLNLGGHRRDCGCGDRCAHNVFHGFTTAAPCNSCCDSGGIERQGWGSGPGLLSRLRAKFGHKECCDAAPACCATPSCAVPPIPVAPPPVTPPPATPEKMPAPAKDKKDTSGTIRVVPGLSPVAKGGSPF